MADTKRDQNTQTALATTSARFVAEVERQFAAEMGGALAWTEYQKTLAQHLFLKVDMQLKALEAKRIDGGKDAPPITWDNVNLSKLALDGVHRVSLGLDALIANHIHPIPYFNRRIGKYDLDLRVGYVGKDYCRRKLAVEEPVDVVYELVYDTDKFVPYFRSRTNEIESYDFEVTSPFKRGDVIGGFGYIVYQDPKKNRLIIVTQRDFDRAEAAARTKDFWSKDKSRIEMQYKTLVHRVTDKIPLDPRKANSASYTYVEAQESETSFDQQVVADANGEIIDVDGVVQYDAPEPPQAPPQQPPQANGATRQQTLVESVGPSF